MKTPTEPLTERERTVLEMLAAGCRDDEIEDALVDPNSDFVEVCEYMLPIRRKLGAKNTEHAIALAIRGGHIL